MCPFWHNMASWAEKPKGLSHELPQYNNNKQNFVYKYINIYISEALLYIGGMGTSYKKGHFVCLHPPPPPPKKDAFLSFF